MFCDIDLTGDALILKVHNQRDPQECLGYVSLNQYSPYWLLECYDASFGMCALVPGDAQDVEPQRYQ